MNTPCRAPKRRVSCTRQLREHLNAITNDRNNATPKTDTEFFFDFDEESKLHLQLALLTTKDAPSMKAAASSSQKQFLPRQDVVCGVPKLDDTESTADSSCSSSSIVSSSSSDTFPDHELLSLEEEDDHFDDEYDQEEEDDAIDYLSDDGEDDSTVSYTHDSNCDECSIHSFSSSSNEDFPNDFGDEGDHSYSLDEVVSPRETITTHASSLPIISSAPLLEQEPFTPVQRESKPILKQHPLTSSSATKRVRFGTAKVREYALTVGAYSSVDDSCPLQLSWEHSPSKQMPLRDMLTVSSSSRNAERRAQRQERSQRLRRLSLQERRERIAAIQGISLEEAGTIEYKNLLQMIENTKLHIDQALLDMDMAATQEEDCN